MIKAKKDKKGPGIQVEISGELEDVVDEYMAMIRAVENIEALRDAVGDALDKAVNGTEERENEIHRELS